MNDFIETVELAELLMSEKILYQDRDFEDLYDELSHTHRDTALLDEVNIRIHNYFAKVKIGKTTVINPGFGRDAQMLVEIVNKKVKKVEFWKR